MVLVAALATPAWGAQGAAGPGDSAPEALFARGMDLYRSGDFNGAAVAFLQAASRRPGYLEARFFAGESLLKGFPTDLPGAEAQFLEILRIQPEHLDGMLSLAQTYYEWGHYEQAAEILKKVLALSPDHRGALYYSGVLASRKGNYAAAVDFLRAALRTDPTHLPSRIELGLALSHMSRNEEALAAFQEVLKADPDNERALFGAGNSLTRLGRTEEAKAVLLKFRSVATSRENAEMKESRIQLWLQETRKSYEAGKLDEARRSIGRLLEEYPDEPRGLASLGWLQEKAGDDVAARSTYERVLALDPGNLTANHQLIGIYARMGAKDRAAAQKARYDELARAAASGKGGN